VGAEDGTDVRVEVGPGCSSREITLGVAPVGLTVFSIVLRAASRGLAWALDLMAKSRSGGAGDGALGIGFAGVFCVSERAVLEEGSAGSAWIMRVDHADRSHDLRSKGRHCGDGNKKAMWINTLSSSARTNPRPVAERNSRMGLGACVNIPRNAARTLTDAILACDFKAGAAACTCGLETGFFGMMRKDRSHLKFRMRQKI
jgi:hypothetical protein